MDKVERLYFKERYIKHADRNGLKRLLLKDTVYGQTAKRIIFNLSGKWKPTGKLSSQSGDQEEQLDKVGKRIKSALKSDRKDGLNTPVQQTGRLSQT